MHDSSPNEIQFVSNAVSRRTLLAALPAVVTTAAFTRVENASAEPPTTQPDRTDRPEIPWFPSQDPKRVREMVGVSHRDVRRVRELLAASPALAKATYDWGFGDWETALGAASHVGNREIAGVLIEHGARPDIFTFAMLGQLDVVKAYVAANPGIQRVHGPHGITLLRHARAGGAESAAVVEYLEQLGDADNGYTSLPLSEAERQVYVGRYSFGPGPNNAAEITVTRDGGLAIKGPDGTPRNLFHLGEHTFHPAGAPEVRIRFTVANGRAESVRVLDPGVIIEARRHLS